ncbi:MAG: potassium channel family protein [Armatimonadetes bacterium]|nr:potassium channel family protein [Armatimonadota bacterium]
MNLLAVISGVLLFGVVLVDTFETMILPRTVTRRFRLTRLFYMLVGRANRFLLKLEHNPSLREAQLNAYAPLSLLGLIVLWAGMLILAFALVHWGLKVPLHGEMLRSDLGTYLYFSGVTFLTLGFGDVTATNGIGRFLAVMEAGVGFGFLAIVISYLPVLYQSFSRRETTICMLDARAGSPPTSAELLRRYSERENMPELVELLKEYERWSAELLESFLSYPILAFYRSQHDQQSWLSALTAVLDTCAIGRLEFANAPAWQKALQWQAYLTFAMARHAIIDLALILYIEPQDPPMNRLDDEQWQRLTHSLKHAGVPLADTSATTRAQLAEMRKQYEPYVYSLSKALFLELPPWIMKEATADNWQTSAWETDGHLK